MIEIIKTYDHKRDPSGGDYAYIYRTNFQVTGSADAVNLPTQIAKGLTEAGGSVLPKVLHGSQAHTADYSWVAELGNDDIWSPVYNGGRCLAKDITDGEYGDVSSVKDTNLKNCIRVVDAAPYVYCQDVDGNLTHIKTDANGAVIVNTERPTTPTILNVSLASANTEYSFTLPVGCKRVRVSIIDGAAADNFRLAFAAGKVATPTAPYLKFSQDKSWSHDSLGYEGTVYMASSAAGKVAQVEYWV